MRAVALITDPTLAIIALGYLLVDKTAAYRTMLHEIRSQLVPGERLELSLPFRNWILKSAPSDLNSTRPY
jgi:hypothetical protein